MRSYRSNTSLGFQQTNGFLDTLCESTGMDLPVSHCTSLASADFESSLLQSPDLLCGKSQRIDFTQFRSPELSKFTDKMLNLILSHERKFEHTGIDPYDLVTSRVYDSKTFKIPRPFPIDQIYFETSCSPKPGILALRFRTPLGQSQIFHKLSDIPWYKPFRKMHSGDKITCHFNLDKHNIQEIKVLFHNIFMQLLSLAETDSVQDVLKSTQDELMHMLVMYQQDFLDDFPDCNHYYNGRYVKTPPASMTETVSAREMHEAITHIDTGKVLDLLKKGFDPDAFFDGYSPLSAAILFGTMHALRFKGRDKAQLLDSVLSIIRLLLEYGANPMLESRDHTAMEHVIIASTQARYYTIDFYAAILQLLTAGRGIEPHIFVAEQEKNETMGLIVSGANAFLKEITQIHTNKIIDCFKRDQLYFLTVFNTCIRVKTIILDNLSQQTRQFLYEDESLRQLFHRHFPKQPASYFSELLENNTSAIDVIYLNNQLSGINVVRTAYIPSNKPFILHYIKLAIADKTLRAFPRLMSIISLARGFSLQNKFPMSEVITYFEAGSDYGYLQACSLDMFPKTNRLREKMEYIGNYLYPEKLLVLENAILVKDTLGEAKKTDAPLLFWDRNPKNTHKLPAKIDQDNRNRFFLTQTHLAQQAFQERYLQNRQQYCVTVGFLNTPENLERLERKINPHCADTFKKAIDFFGDIGPDPADLRPAKL